MAEPSPTPQSPLAGLAGADLIRLREAALVGKLIIRGGGEAFRAAVEAAVGAAPPSSPNTTAAAGEALILWLGPDEWQIQCPPQDVQAVAAKLRAAWGEAHAAAVEVSDYYIQLEIGGAHARAVLESGCPLDLHPRAFGAGDCAQTRYHNAAILLRPTADGYNIQVRRSFAAYVWKHLRSAAREFA